MIPRKSLVGIVPLTNSENANKTQGIIGARKLKMPKKVIMAEGFLRHQT